MLKFVVRRMFWTIPIILLVILMTFLLDAADQGQPVPQDRARRPGLRCSRTSTASSASTSPGTPSTRTTSKGVATLDLGPSLVLRNQDVNDIVREHFPVSAELGGLAMLLAIIVGVPLGILSALRANTSPDYVAQLFSNLGFAIPDVPRGDAAHLLLRGEVGAHPGSRRTAGTRRQSKVLPVIALCLSPLTYFARLVRGQMLETLQQDYVRTAKAKGLRWQRIVGRARAAQLADPGRDGGRARCSASSSPARSSSRTSSRSPGSAGTT